MRFHISKNIRLLSLDAMDTLIALKEPPGTTYARFAKKFGIAADPDVLNSRFPAVFKEVDQRHPCYGFNSFGATQWWFEVIKKCFGEDYHFKDEAVAEEMCYSLFDYYGTKEPWRLLELDAFKQLDRLRSNGLSVSITSNFDARLRSVLLEFGILNHVDFIALSGEIGFAKPDPKIFECLLEFFNIESPNQILHVGDSLTKDVEGAANFGAVTCLYRPKDSVKFEGKVPVISTLGDLDFEE
uniref:Haloacid dehalogenase-like hydrolase domain-containing protein 3 n=1 Tax=Panagrolaimus sp. JU765 TaxID=591449 RepID=A0AC34QRP3_9BILA